MFCHDRPLAVKPASTPRRLVHKKMWRDSLPIDMLLSAVSVLVVAQPSPEFPEGLVNYPVHSNQPRNYVQTTNTNSMLQTYNSDVCCNSFIHSFIPLACAEFDDSLSFLFVAMAMQKQTVVSNHSHIMNSEKSYHRLQCLWRTFHGGNVSRVSAARECVACNYRHSLQG